MRSIYILISFLFLTACSADIEHRKAVINFKASQDDFKTVKKILQKIAYDKKASVTDSSYTFGTKESPQIRLHLHIKDSNNLEIYTNCYSDWQECSIEFLCYKTCIDWNKAVDLLVNNITEKWEIINTYKNNNS